MRLFPSIRCFCVLASAALFSLPTDAVTPIWSVQVGQSIPDSQPLATRDLAILPGGSGNFLAYVPASTMIAALRVGVDGSLQRSQFAYDLAYSPDDSEILASADDRTLLRMEVDSQHQIYMVDSSGRVLWAQARPAQTARLLAGGDVILVSGNTLLRLRGSDGALLWSRSFLELHPTAWGLYGAAIGEEVDGQIELALTLRTNRLRGGSPQATSLVLAFDPADGALRWSQTLASAREVAERCPMVRDADSLVMVWAESDLITTDLVVERRKRVSGNLDWAMRLPAERYADDCGLALTGGRIYLSVPMEGGMRVDALDAAGGAPQWQRIFTGGVKARLRGSTDGDLLATLLAWEDESGLTTSMMRLGQSDGVSGWQIPLGNAAVEWRPLGGEISLALAAENGVRLQRRDAATGALLKEFSAQITGRTAPYRAIGFVDGLACYAVAIDTQSFHLECRDGLSGALRWSRDIAPLTGTDTLAGFRILGLAAGRLGINVYLQREFGGQPVLFTRPIGVDLADGAIAWQLPEQPDVPVILPADDGGAFLSHATCSTQPGCGGATPYVSRFSGLDGSVLWTRPSSGSVMAARGDVLVQRAVPDYNQSYWSELDARSGGERWVQPVANGNFIRPAAMVTPGGRVLTKHETVLGGAIREIELTGLDPQTGVPLWTVRPNVPRTRSFSGFLSALSGDDVLFVGRREFSVGGRNVVGPWIARVDGASGTVRWEQAPAAGQEALRRMRAIPATGGGVHLVEQIREFSEQLQRRTLATLLPESGVAVAEHQYSRGRWMPRYEFDEVLPAATLPDGSVLVENLQARIDGLQIPSLQRWPAPSGPVGDIQLDVLTPTPILGHGASTLVEVRIRNPGAVAVAGLRLGFTSDHADLQARFLDCDLTDACGQADASGDVSLDLAPASAVVARWEVFSQRYLPVRDLATSLDGRFHVDTPFEFGDVDFDNHTATISVVLGGTSSGFE